MDAHELQDRIAAFPVWNYEFDFGAGIRTPVASRQWANRHEQRRRYFFQALLGLTGGSLAGRRVLDLGCSSGYWALQAIDAGAEFVLGIDGDTTAIEQARLVFEAKGVDVGRYRLEQANVFGYELEGSFDMVLCLGLLSVVAKPVELFELMARSGAELIVIDTGLSRLPSSAFEVSRLNEPRNALDHELGLVPTRRAVVELARRFGYQAAALARNIEDYASMEDYRDGERLAFVCSKTTPLGSLDLEAQPPENQWLAMLERAARRLRR
jgi:SAM-dependent methyltransferase